MQYIFLLYDDERISRMSEAEQQSALGAFAAYTEKLQSAGVMVGGEPLDDAHTAKTLRPGGFVEDGPYADTKENLGGYYVIDVETIAQALEWAKQCPIAEWGHIEVRAIPNFSG